MSHLVTGIVLCGGQSARMGRDKASLPFGPETLLTRVVRLLRVAVPHVVLVARPGQALPDLDAPVVYDTTPGAGPLAGIAAGLAACTTELGFVVACDMPFLQPDVVNRLLAFLGDADACVPSVDGQSMPLCGVYRRHLHGRAAQLAAGDDRRVRRLLDEVRTRLVDRAALEDVDPGLLSVENCNTAAQYEAALVRAGYGRFTSEDACLNS